MDNEKMFIQFAEGQTQAEVIIREGEAVEQLPIKAPIKTNLSGVIETPAEYLTRRCQLSDQFDENHAHVVVDRENVSITLVFNESDEYTKGTVTGKLQLHPKFVEFGINSNKGWQPNKLGEFFKRNRAYFDNKEYCMDLVAKLKSFTATVQTQIEQERQQNGSFKDNYSGVVNNNLPDSFKLKLPIFKGANAEELEVEIYAEVDGRDVELVLVSAAACEVFEERRDNIIDEQKAAIRELCPNIVIVEK